MDCTKDAWTDGLARSFQWASLPPTLSRLDNYDSYLEGLCRELVSKILSGLEQYKGTLNRYPIFQVNSLANSMSLVESLKSELGDRAREQSPNYP